jgi:hypothetical protein
LGSHISQRQQGLVRHFRDEIEDRIKAHKQKAA